MNPLPAHGLHPGDTVVVTPHTNKLPDGSVQLFLATVVNRHRPTDMRRVDGTPVGFYVDVRAAPDGPLLGYHLESLEKV